jgi:hypothetical protein
MSHILKKELRNIDIITFTNVFAHIEDFKNLLQSLKNIITKDTLLVIENHYLGEVIKKNQFDTFYHEHPRTYRRASKRNHCSLLRPRNASANRYGNRIVLEHLSRRISNM